MRRNLIKKNYNVFFYWFNYTSYFFSFNDNKGTCLYIDVSKQFDTFEEATNKTKLIINTQYKLMIYEDSYQKINENSEMKFISCSTDIYSNSKAHIAGLVFFSIFIVLVIGLTIYIYIHKNKNYSL